LVRLTSTDGSFIDLRVAGYQFPEARGHGKWRDWDANWLVIRGEVNDGGRNSAFADPCLTTWEARELASWLRGVATGVIPAVPDPDDDDVRLTVFTEPNIALSVAERSGTVVRIRVHLSLEARPAWVTGDEDLFGYFVGLTLPVEDVAAAADEWDAELGSFPGR
jgi:hypothetical protein